jgi:sugar lactone lactonase YvrE
VISFFIMENAYAIEINISPEKDPFGPNDSLSILIEVVDYQGGNVKWVANKPDGSSDSGELTAIKGGKKNHVIARNAYDGQFGKWSIEYTYKDFTKIESITVEPLIIELTTDKQNYLPGESVFLTINSNYFEPNAAKADSYSIEILDSNDIPAQHMQSTEIKAYQASTNFSFLVNELVKNNPFGDYKILVEYFNSVFEVSFSVLQEGVGTTIFIGTDKPLYDAGALVEVQIIISELIDSNAVITITDPFGKNTIRSFPIESSLTRLLLDDVSTTSPGTYQITLEYGGNSQVKSGNQGVKITKPMSSGSTITLLNLPTNAEFGPWKFYVEYGGAISYDIFFVESDSGVKITTVDENYEGPKLLMIIDSTKTNLNQPTGIAIDSKQNIYVVDAGNFEVKKLDSAGRLLTSWGSFGSEEGQFKNPSEILVDSNFVHVADTGNSRIQTFDTDGNYMRSWGDSGIRSQSLTSPVSISVDSDGNFVVSDTALNKISKYDISGNYAGHIESIVTAAAKFYGSNSVVVDESDHVLFLASEDNRVLQYDVDGNFIKSFGTTGEDEGKFQNPTALAFDSQGNLYVSDSGNYRIQVFDPNKKFLTSWGSLGSQPGQFNQISDIAVDSLGNVFVVEVTNSRIQKFAPFSENNVLEIPDWVRNNAKWWNEGTINDSDFANGIQYMIKNQIIVIPDLAESGETSEQQIPDWVKNNAGWWAAGQISDEDFANGIEFLVINGIIAV